MQQFDRVKVTSAKTVSKVPPEGPVLQELLGRDRAVKTTHKTLAQIVCEVQKNTAKRPCLRPALLVKMFIRYGQKCGFASTYLDKHK